MEGHRLELLFQAIIRSLRGTAAKVLQNRGNNPTVHEILTKFDVTFGI